MLLIFHIIHSAADSIIILLLFAKYYFKTRLYADIIVQDLHVRRNCNLYVDEYYFIYFIYPRKHVILTAYFNIVLWMFDTIVATLQMVPSQGLEGLGRM